MQPTRNTTGLRDGRDRKKAKKLKKKGDAKHEKLQETQKDVWECKWKELYLQAFLDKDSIEEIEWIRCMEDPSDSDDATDSESSNSSPAVTSGQSSSSSEANTLEAEAEETHAGEADSSAQVEVPDAAEEDTMMEEDLQEDVTGNVPPLSPATHAESDLLDLMEHVDPNPPLTPGGVTDSMSGLQIASPHLEVKDAKPQGQ